MKISVQVEQTKKNVRQLTVSIPSERVDRYYQASFAETQKKAKLKGFRPGKAPISVIRQYYGDQIQQKVLTRLIDESYREAIESESLRVVSQPSIAPTKGHQHFHLEEGKGLDFVATVEVFPEFEVKSYEGLSVKKEKVKIESKEVDQVIDNIRQSRAEMVPLLEVRPVKKGDFVDVNFDGGIVTPEGIEKKEGMAGNQVVEIGSNTFIEGFEDQLLGLDVGASKTFRIPFPEKYHEASLAGKEAEFAVKVNSIKKKKLPELNEAFAKELEYGSVEELRKKTQENIEKYRNEEADRKLRNDLLNELIKKNKFEVPEGMIQAQAKILAEDMMRNLQGQGFDPEAAKQALLSEQENLKTRAENQVRAGLLLDKVAEIEKIEVTEENLNAEIETMAKSMNQDPKNIREYYLGNAERKESLEFRVRENLTVQRILDKAKVK